MNRALPEARGNLILFTDDDILPVPSWLKDYHEGAERWPGQEIFCGPVEPLFPPGTPETLRYPSFRYASVAYVYFLPSGGEGLIDWLPVGPNYAVRSRTLRSYEFCETIGPTDGPNFALGDETELLERLTARGERCVHLPGARVSHIVREEQLTLRWLMGRGFRYGRCLIRLERGPNFERNCKRDTSSTRLFGAPRYLWREMLTMGITSYLHRILRTPKRWESAFAYKVVQGQIYEYRTINAGGYPLRSSTGNGTATE